jgi:hypothetical protein
MSNPTSQAEKTELDVSFPMPFHFSNSYEKGGSLAGNPPVVLRINFTGSISAQGKLFQDD